MQDSVEAQSTATFDPPGASGCDVVPFNPEPPQKPAETKDGRHLKAPTLGQLLQITFSDRQHLLAPWLREHENCMVYAGTGVGKSLFALSAALAVAGGGEFLGWKPDKRADGGSWRVLYIDGEMHIADIQARARMLLDAIPSVDKRRAMENLRFISRQHQEAAVAFPLITEAAGMKFVREAVRENKIDLVILDNFSTLGEVKDENAASSFNDIQQFLLGMKTQRVATMLIHHAGKAEETFRGSSKLAATFETIVRLERIGKTVEHGAAAFRVRWDKVRAGGPKRIVREVATKLVHEEVVFDGPSVARWTYETADIERLDELAELLRDGRFVSQREIADHFGVSETMAGKYVKNGERVGLWTREQVKRWLANGKGRRTKGQTWAPVRPHPGDLEGLNEPGEARPGDGGALEDVL